MYHLAMTLSRLLASFLSLTMSSFWYLICFFFSLKFIATAAILCTAWNSYLLWRNVCVAKKSGLPYVVVPWYSYNQLSAFLLSGILLKYINAFLPEAGVLSWRRLVSGGWTLKLRNAPFARLGSDTFWLVAPGGLILNTSDAGVIHDVISRSSAFPKATAIYKGIAMYGENVVSSDGHVWKHHRNFVSKAFGDRNNRLVWNETMTRMQIVLKGWGKKTVHDIQLDTSRVSLEVIGRAALGQSIEWSQAIEAGEDARSLAQGFTMNFSSALKFVASKPLIIASLRRVWIPWKLLKRLPATRELCSAYENWELYMREMISVKRRSKTASTPTSRATDLLQLLCESQDQKSLTDSEVLGNLFVFVIAGHETSASSIHMTLVLLALHPEFQKEIQEELEEVFQGRPPSQWSFEKDFHPLSNCVMLVAAWKEEMRLVTPIVSIPKVVCSTPQQVEVNNKHISIPPGTIIRLSAPSVHVNPQFWPHGKPTDPARPSFSLDNLNNDLEEYNPRRWIEKDSATRKRLFNPVKGSFIPFSAGARSCLGSKFATVEILLALALIFSTYSVELATDEYANDEDIPYMSADEKKNVWCKAAENARYKWKNKMTCTFTVQLNEDIPLRFVKKGEEKFLNI